MVSAHLLVIVVVAVVTLGSVATLRRVGVPAAVVLVIAGLIIGFLPFVPDVSLDPEVVLLGILPLLVFDAAATASPTALSRDAPVIGLLATGLVIATALAVAAVAHWVGHLSWPMGFVLGTAVGPTDAAAAISIGRRLGLPRRLLTLLEGEALFNDATALVLYAAAVTAATTDRFSALGTAGSVLYSIAIGTAIGIAVGLTGRLLRGRVDDAPIAIAGSMLLAYIAYLPAEALHASGVLAAVTAGLYLGWHSGAGMLPARSRLQSAAFWHTLVFLLNAALFVLVGLSFHTFTTQARGPLGQLTITGLGVVAAVIAIRLAWMGATHALVRVSRRRRAPTPDADVPQNGWREPLLVGWSGMRGAITLAALLAVPVTTDAGRPVGGRADIIYLGFAVIIATLVGQGMSLPLLVRRLKLAEHPSVAEAERRARIELTRSALEYVNTEASRLPASAELLDGLREQYRQRLDRLEHAAGQDLNAQPVTHNLEQTVRLELVATQRRQLHQLRRERRIGTTTMRSLEHDLDLEDARFTAT